MKIGLHVMGSDTWLAGVAYVQDLLWALRETRVAGPELLVLTRGSPTAVPEELARVAHGVLAYPSIARWTLRWLANGVVRRATGRDLYEDAWLRRHDVRVTAFGSWTGRSPIPRLLWLPDFQHYHHPDMFSHAEREARTRAFRWVAAHASRVLLLSEAVRRDFASFAPARRDRARVLRHASYIPASVYATDPGGVTDRYHLPARFVYLPNQFWRHKNHGTAFRALRLLKERGLEIHLVCSGHPGDYRHPRHFADLWRELSEWDLRPQVTFLGVIPREHVFSLMRQSVCVLNPSLFEGYGMTVDEARSVGKRVLASDIAAHREQDVRAVTFFDPRDAEDLATKLRTIWQESKPGPDRELEAEARESLRDRLSAYADSFLSVVEEVVSAPGEAG